MRNHVERSLALFAIRLHVGSAPRGLAFRKVYTEEGEKLTEIDSTFVMLESIPAEYVVVVANINRSHRDEQNMIVKKTKERRRACISVQFGPIEKRN